jgi:hypothetical protein
MSRRNLLVALAVASLCGCAQQPLSPQADLAAGIVRLANMPGRTSGQVVESTLRLSQNGLELKYPTEWRYVVKANDLVRFDAVRADATIKNVFIDNISHGGAPHEQEIRVNVAEGTCLTLDLMRSASGVVPVPYKDLWVPPPHYPPALLSAADVRPGVRDAGPLSLGPAQDPARRQASMLRSHRRDEVLQGRLNVPLVASGQTEHRMI